MDRNHHKVPDRSLFVILLIASLGAFAACGGGGGGAAPVTAPGSFTLSAPTGTGVVPTPTLSWAAASGASLYTVQVTTNPTFSTITTYESTTITTTSVILSGLSPSTVYYWRVTARNSVGTTTSIPASAQFTTKKSGELVWAKSADPIVNHPDEIFGVAVDSTALYAVGYDTNTDLFDHEWRIEKRDLATGNLFSGFNTTGIVVTNPSAATINSFDDAYAIALDSTFMYVVGSDAFPDVVSGPTPSLTNDQWHIEKRRLDTGALDTSFNSSGVLVSNPSLSIDEATAIAIDSQYMYVAGYETTGTRGQAWRIEKYLLTSGAPVAFSGTGGAITSDPSDRDDIAWTIAIDDTYMYVAGSETNGLGLLQWRVEKRRLDTGGYDASFGVLGVVSIPTTTFDAEIYSVATDTQYLYIAGYTPVFIGNSAWKIMKINKSDGAPIWEQTSNPNPDKDNYPLSIAVDANYVYIAGNEDIDTSIGGSEIQWRVEKRHLSDGSPDTAFAANGVYQSHPSAGSASDDVIWAMSSDGDYLYVAGYDSNTAGVTFNGKKEWRIEKIVK